jgi:hypothetical protein
MIVWLVMWACSGADCRWLDKPMPDIQPVTINGQTFLDPSRCLPASFGDQSDIIHGGKVEIKQVSCVVMYDGEQPGPLEHVLREHHH